MKTWPFPRKSLALIVASYNSEFHNRKVGIIAFERYVLFKRTVLLSFNEVNKRENRPDLPRLCTHIFMQPNLARMGCPK